MSDNQASDGDTEAAIAAAAYAIAMMEEVGSPKANKPIEKLRKAPSKTNSKREENSKKPADIDTNSITRATDTGMISRMPSVKEEKGEGKSKASSGEKSMRKSATFDQTMLEDSAGSGEKTMRKSKSLDQVMLEDSIADRNMPEKETKKTPSIKKTPTFSDKYLNDTESERFEGKPTETLRYPHTAMPKKEETKADMWENEQMGKIRKRYEKINYKILQWENEKKTKAKRRMERKERELEERRARYIQEYRNDMSRINKIISGAKAASEERKRNEELKAKEKAKQLRSTGKVPHQCCCF